MTTEISKMEIKRENIPALLKQVEEQINTLKGSIANKVSTAGKVLPGFDTIKNINSLQELIQARSSVLGKEKAYKEQVKEMQKLGIINKKYPKFTIGGCTAKDWVEDIDLRYKEVSHKDELDRLNKAKQILKDNLDKEAKFASDMADLLSGKY